MSKNQSTTNHPIILKKDESQRQQKVRSHQPVQPKILTKIITKENGSSESSTVSKKDPDVMYDVASMKSNRRLVHSHFQLDQRVLDFLSPDNVDFLIVGTIGLKDVGKSTLLNIIADNRYVHHGEDNDKITLDKEYQTFPTTGSTGEGNTIDMFITTDRVVLLDTAPLLCNVQRRDFMVSETDDLKLVLMMLQLCHVVLVVHDGFLNVSIARLIAVADQIIPKDMKHRPLMVYVGNRVQPGVQPEMPSYVSDRILKGVSLTVPDITNPGVHLHHDIRQTIDDLCEKIYMMKRYSMDGDEEPFNEKKWSQRISTVMDQMKSDYFLRKYEALRDKFHQQIEGM